MSTRVKIKLLDDGAMRNILDDLYESSTQIEICQYALQLAKHILILVDKQYINHPLIQEGFHMNELWQNGDARMHDVRQIGFKIHKMAKECDDVVQQTAFRVVGQAVATGHMKEHGMVASDYAIKVINLLYPNDIAAVSKERQWQIECIKSVITN